MGLGVLAALSLGSAGSPAGAVSSIRFTDQPRKNLLRITTPSYELILNRKNGGILSLVDRAAKKQLVVGEGGCIWGARADASTDYIGGCSFSRTGAARFSYRWNQRAARLTLKYTPKAGAPEGISATATLSASATYFDLGVTIENHLHRLLSSMLVPADLLGVSGDVTAGYAPNFLPGIRLRPSFFKGSLSNILTYPGRYVWADYLALDEGAGHLALYSANADPDPIRPVEVGFVRTAPGSFCGDTHFCITHSFDTSIADGGTWTSPLVRIRVGEPVDKTLLGYRQDNGIDTWLSVADKLGAQATKYERSPLIKADLRKNLPPFVAWDTQLARLPSPALVHPVRYQPGSFDEFAPDFLPPDPSIGTTADLRSMVAAAHARGLLVMPYLNVSWWNVNSPTVHKLLEQGGPQQFAALDKNGNPRLEPYVPFMGYVVSPYTQAVRDRVRALMDQWQQETPTDCYFIDQLGARPWIRDYNPAAPNSLSYYDGWLALMAPYASRCLMVEDGWDRLAKSFSGFHGGLLDVQRESLEADKVFGPGNWEPYPMAEVVLHDKVLMYQHDLAEQTMTTDPYTLTFNLAYGFMLSYTWDGTTDSLESPWLDVVGSFQHALGALYAGQPLQDFRAVGANQTVTEFPNLTVTANWNGSSPGFLAQAKDDSVTAGSVTGTFDGSALSPGIHDLIVTRTIAEVTVHQPLGADTPVSVRVPASWTAGSPVHATWLGADGLTHTVGGTVQGGRFTLTCAGPQPGLPAPTYRITRG